MDVPSVNPDTKPVVGDTDATIGELVDHTPPVVLLLNSVVMPRHAAGSPLIAAGTGFTVICFITTHPEPIV